MMRLVLRISIIRWCRDQAWLNTSLTNFQKADNAVGSICIMFGTPFIQKMSNRSFNTQTNKEMQLMGQDKERTPSSLVKDGNRNWMSHHSWADSAEECQLYWKPKVRLLQSQKKELDMTHSILKRKSKNQLRRSNRTPMIKMMLLLLWILVVKKRKLLLNSSPRM